MLAERLRNVKERIRLAAERGGRDAGTITLVAVTKTVEVDVIGEAYATGLVDFGENRLQDALPKIKALSKIKALPTSVNWHFIGYLQTNKVRDVLRNFSMIHSLDRMNLALALEKTALTLAVKMPVLIQVNTSGEESKAGLAPGEVKDFLEYLKDFKQLKVQGLMTMAPFTADPEEVRPFFRQLREIKEEIKVPGMELKYLSMGMSNDYEVAVEEGANIIRLGTTLFGER